MIKRITDRLLYIEKLCHAKIEKYWQGMGKCECIYTYVAVINLLVLNDFFYIVISMLHEQQ